MKNVILIIAFVLFALSGTAQNKGFTQKVERVKDTLYLIENDRMYKVNPTVITIKLKSTEKSLGPGYNVIRSNRLGYMDIRVPDGIDVEEYVRKLKQTGKFETVEFDGEAKCCFTPNDTHLSSQWYIGCINLYNAWNFTKGNPNIKVAIIDTGVDASHHDLGYTVNDGYSQIDTINGVNYTQVPNAHISPVYPHGTFVAGIIGAKTNNATDIAGICGGDHSKGITIIPYCVGNEAVFTSYSIDDAILDAVDEGVSVINISLQTPHTSAVDAAIDAAYANNVNIVCSTGNGNTNTIQYPASHVKTIAVGAMDGSYHRADVSQYGTGLDFVAPGEAIYSTVLNNDCWYQYNGTSGAAPQVSGVIALMLSVNPNLSPSQIKEILKRSCTKLSGYSYNYTGWNEEVGYGLLDAFAAVLIANNCSISGPSCICSSSSGVYTVNNLPSSFSVLWDFTDGFGTCTSSMHMSGHTCTIANNQSKSYMGTLTAKIYDNNANLLYTLKKENVALYANFYGTCSGGYLPNPELQPNATIFVSKGSGVILKSPNFVLKNISHSITTPSFWDYNNSTGELSVSYPYVTTNNPIIINVQNNTNYSDCDNSYVFAIMPNNVLHGYALNATIDGNGTCVVSLVDKENSAEVSSMLANYGITATKKESWILEVFNATSGRKVFSQEMTERSCSFNTAGWDSGLYAIKAVIGNEELSEKLVIK